MHFCVKAELNLVGVRKPRQPKTRRGLSGGKCFRGDISRLKTRGYLDATRRIRILTGRIVGRVAESDNEKADRRSVGYQASEPAGYQRKLAESWLHSSKLQTVSPHPNTVGGLVY